MNENVVIFLSRDDARRALVMTAAIMRKIDRIIRIVEESAPQCEVHDPQATIRT